MMLTSKKGVSALQVKRVMGFGSYETALYMCNRIRAGLSEHRPDKLGGYRRSGRNLHRWEGQKQTLG